MADALTFAWFRWRWRALAGACAVASLAAFAQETRLVEDPPLVPAPRKGAVSGTIRPAAKLASLQAVSRETKRTYAPAEWDKAGGRFAFRDLPGDAAYDLVLTLADGRVIEGIDLEMPDARLARLADVRRKQLGLPGLPSHAFSADDANEIARYVAKMEDFVDLRRTLYIQGHGGQAAALVELMRTKEYYAARPGELIWRVELWYFQFNHGSWERIPESERVLRRERIPHEKWARISVEYDPALSVYVDPNGASKAVDYTIPDKPDPSRGRPAGTKPELDTPPHVMGVQRGTTGTQPSSPDQ